MKIQKTKLAKFDWLSPTITAWINLEKGYLLIKHKWLLGFSEESLKLAGIEDIIVEQGGLLPMLFNYGTLVFKAEGDTRLRLKWVKHPHYYQRILTGRQKA